MKKLSIILTTSLLVYALVGFFLVPYIIKKQAEKQVQLIYGVLPTVEKIYFNPFNFELEITNLVIISDTADDNPQNRLVLGRINVNLEILPLFKKEIRLSSLYLGQTTADFIVLKEGSTNWTPQPSYIELQASKEVKIEEDAKPWVLTLENLEIAQTSLHLSDRTLRETFELPLGPINLQARNLSTSLGSKTALEKLEISFGNGGFLQVAGSASFKPLAAAIKLKIQDLALDFLTPYLLEKTHLVLNQGSMNFNGDIDYQNGRAEILSNIQVNDFLLLHQASQEKAISWKSLNLNQFKLETKPNQILIKEALLNTLDTKIVLKKNGRLNYSEYMRTAHQKNQKLNAEANLQAKTNASASENTSPFSFQIEKFKMLNGRVNFTDQQIKPIFTADIKQLQGEIAPLTNSEATKMNINMKGQVEAQGKFQAKGSVIANKTKPQLNLDINFENIEMTTFTPYSGQFAGYEISKGKLFLGLNYSLKNQFIRGKNNVVLDQFTLGKAVESEKSTNLPVKLALALLKDREGKIKINLPVEGDVNSPKFSYNEMIWTALKNMLVNIVAAPFDFLKSVIGGGDNVNLVLFEAGSIVLTDNEKNKLSQLAQALIDRPQLAMEIQGNYQLAEAEAIKSTSSKGEKAEEDLKNLALKRAQLIQSFLVEKNIEPERLYILAATLIENNNQPPQVTLLLKSRE